MNLNPCHTRVASLQQRCANTVETLCNRLERPAAAFDLSILKTNATAWPFHSVLNPGHIKA